MILDNPGASPSVIAHAHGFSAAEVAELLPIFLDNLRADFASAEGPAPALVPPPQQPGETPEEHADRYLRELAQNEHLDVGYDALGAAEGDPDDPDLDSADLDSADLDSADLDADLDADTDLDGDTDLDTDPGQDPAFLDAQGETASNEIVELDDATAGEADEDLPDLAQDDPFAAQPTDAADTDDTFDDGPIDSAMDGDIPDTGVPTDADDPGEPFPVS
jgi:hypothetical protein